MGKGPAVHIVGLDEFKRDLKAAGGNWPKELRKANLKVAREVVLPSAKSRMAAVHMTNNAGGSIGKMFANVAATIKAAASQSNARLDVPGTLPYAAGAVFGSKRWQQFAPWIGAEWVPGENGGPYGIGPAVHDKLPEIVSTYEQMIFELYAKAFPHRAG